MQTHDIAHNAHKLGPCRQNPLYGVWFSGYSGVISREVLIWATGGDKLNLKELVRYIARCDIKSTVYKPSKTTRHLQLYTIPGSCFLI